MKNKYFFIPLVVVILLILLELIGVVNLLPKSELRNDDNQKTPDYSGGQTDINFDPPTEDEAKSGNEVPLKQDNESEENSDTAPQSSNQTNNVSIVISDAGVYDGKVEISAFTPDAIANGTCTYTFTSESQKIIKTVQARADASSSICLDEPFSASELSKSNTWNLDVRYESTSETYKGSKTTTLNL